MESNETRTIEWAKEEGTKMRERTYEVFENPADHGTAGAAVGVFAHEDLPARLRKAVEADPSAIEWRLWALGDAGEELDDLVVEIYRIPSTEEVRRIGEAIGAKAAKDYIELELAEDLSDGVNPLHMWLGLSRDNIANLPAYCSRWSRFVAEIDDVAASRFEAMVTDAVADSYEPADDSDQECPCGNADCSRAFGHAI